MLENALAPRLERFREVSAEKRCACCVVSLETPELTRRTPQKDILPFNSGIAIQDVRNNQYCLCPTCSQLSEHSFFVKFLYL